MKYKKTVVTSILVAFIASIVALSQWWHSPETKAWLYPTFGYVYEHVQFDTTKKVLDTASDWYLAIDDEYYSNTGAIVEGIVIPGELPARGIPNYSVPTFDEAWQVYSKYLPTAQEQGRTSQCTAYTAENHVEYVKRRMGVKPPLNNLSRTALYEATSVQGTDGGAIYGEVVEYIAQNNYPLPEAGDENIGVDNFTRLKADSARLASVQAHGGQLYTGSITSLNNWTVVKDHYFNMPQDEVMQVNIVITGTWDDYFGKNEVYMTGSNILGGHSTMGAFIAKNAAGTSEGIWVVESAYRPTLLRTSTDGRSIALRYIDRSNFDKGLIMIRFLPTVYTMPFVGVAPDVRIGEGILDVDSFSRYSNTAYQVTAMQTYLADQGYFTYTGPKGYWGSVTSNALSDWLYKKTGTRYSGNYWGGVSRGMYVVSR